ncbi:cysteine and glycine-rich protein 2-like [Belonocnema kinseyi]|uniref:cysteine and glycine-rich protein 2-like n=1 Tax=Belonocnema kinseyi TaxID=2817044 RepID=UPI00143D7A93|nr:cysteine and glycine-rich protein 2-like [Belonocnema kinseyi]
MDCQRCERKVYHAEKQVASGVPFHNICFSCFCCRKPLESLTYQENCGEIYWKQYYGQNFGPQGYGYGIGAGALQTLL